MKKEISEYYLMLSLRGKLETFCLALCACDSAFQVFLQLFVLFLFSPFFFPRVLRPDGCARSMRINMYTYKNQVPRLNEAA